MNLSRHFTLDELTYSNKAKTEGIDNQPTPAETEFLRSPCISVLDPLRDAVGKPIKVNSGYRGPALNKRLNGVAKSQHLNEQAADIECPAITVLDIFKKVIQLQLPFDQVIYEVKGASKWVHVLHNPGTNRGVILLADAPGKVTYAGFTAQQAPEITELVSRSAVVEGPSEYVEMAD